MAIEPRQSGRHSGRRTTEISSLPAIFRVHWSHVTAVLAGLLLMSCTSQPSAGADQPSPGAELEVWSSADVGDTAFAGATEWSPTGVPVRVMGSGTDVWNESDGFHFSFRELRGNGSITTRVDEIGAADEWTKVGVMVRDGLSPTAPNAFMLLTQERGAAFQGRLVAGGPTSDTLADGRVMAVPGPRAPYWLRIERVGNEVIGSHSQDGSSWSELGRLTLALPERVLIGTAVTSRNNGNTASARFTDVLLTRETGPVFIAPPDAARPDPGYEADRDPTPEPSPDPVPGPITIPGPTTSMSYTRDSSTFPNPERGLVGHGHPANYDRLSSEGLTLGHRNVRLDNYRNQPLPASFLDELRRDLEAARGSGIKLTVRFMYNHGFEPDAPLERVLEHIAQLAPILQEYSDVIALVHAGFIGAWGEWHASTNGLLTLQNRQAITTALLAAIPPERMTQIRTPYLARDLVPLPTATTAFTSVAAARVGQKNDCFLANASDAGTFLDAADFAYVEAVTRFTAMGGETCSAGGLSSYNDGARAVEQMTRFHFDFLNRDFYQPILDKWRAQGYFDEIERRLGYRYVMRQATVMQSVAAGQTLSMSLRIENEGFGKLYNPRPLNLALVPRAGGTPVVLQATADARLLLPLAGETRDVMLHVHIPSNLAAGTYDLQLALPDAAATLANDPRYAIRMANTGTWIASTGRNDLQLSIQVNR